VCSGDGEGGGVSRGVSGYDYNFIDILPDRLVCRICHHTSRDPFLSVCCGNTFCSSCLDSAKNADILNCPLCRCENFISVPNKQVDREIKSLHVMCTNKERGCEWQGELTNISKHLGNSDGCQFEDVKCSNKCGEMLQRRYLASHVETECPCRKVNCVYCHRTGGLQFIEGKHKKQCPKVLISCLNVCEIRSVLREDMEAHRRECPLEMIQCEYHNVGCEERMLRKRKKEHEQEKMEEHLSLMKRALTKTQSQLDNALEIMTMLNQGLQGNYFYDAMSVVRWWAGLAAKARKMVSGVEICPVIMNVTECSSLIEWNSDVFFTHEKGYKMCVVIHPNGNEKGKGTHLSVYLHLVKGPHDDELTWPLRGKFEVKLLNQISDCEHHAVTINYDNIDEDFGSIGGRVDDDDDHEVFCWGEPKFVSHENFRKVTPTCQYLRDGCIFLQVSYTYAADSVTVI